jgi:transcriptional regulator with XRE-family HTH domain
MMLAHTLKRLRENCGYTQQQVADALNIDRSTYTYYETAKTTPDINTIIKLAKIFNVSYSQILEEEEHNPKMKDIGSSEGNGFGGRNLGLIYELSKAEKQLIIYFRLMTAEEQDSLLKFAGKRLKNPTK